jgi:hypothetical protein
MIEIVVATTRSWLILSVSWIQMLPSVGFFVLTGVLSKLCFQSHIMNEIMLYIC